MPSHKKPKGKSDIPRRNWVVKVYYVTQGDNYLSTESRRMFYREAKTYYEYMRQMGHDARLIKKE